jgi:hypothetical protein
LWAVVSHERDHTCGLLACCLAVLAMWAVAVGWVWLGVGCDLSDICSDKFRIHPIKVADIRYPTDINHIIFGSDIRSDYPYSYPLSEKKIRISENFIRTSVHHLRIRIRTDIFRTILHP